MKTNSFFKTTSSKLKSVLRYITIARLWQGFVVLSFFYLLSIAGSWMWDAGSHIYHNYILDEIPERYFLAEDITDRYTFYMNGQLGLIRDNHRQHNAVKNVDWVSTLKDSENDSLLCFASKGKRGYFNVNTGDVAIKPNKYTKAWVFSEGLAAVMEEDYSLKFINPQGDVVIDKGFFYSNLPEEQGYVFHNGYCQMATGNDTRWGIINTKGEWVVSPDYSEIEYEDNGLWLLTKGSYKGLLNDSLKTIVETDCYEIAIEDYGIEILRNDFVRQLLDFNGNVTQDFVYTEVSDLMHYFSDTDEYDSPDCKWTLSPYKVYKTTYDYSCKQRVGLMAPDGTRITKPIYSSIVVINDDYFRCYCDYSDVHPNKEGPSVIINKRGEVVSRDISH